jgi:acyl-CoA synthetase (AMP-forming)/AMP-acid ligase II
MTSLAERVAARTGGQPVLISDQRCLSRDDLLMARPLDSRHLGARLAVSLRSTADLLRILTAYDGHAAALLLLSAELDPTVVAALAAAAHCSAIISDRDDVPDAVHPDAALGPATGAAPQAAATAWIMTTSGTTGQPKMVQHSLATLSRSTRAGSAGGPAPVWGLTYEPTRFAGLQVVLQAIIGGGTLVAPDDCAADLAIRLRTLAAAGCTHLSATPTLWRRILMHPAAASLRLRQITLGGEIADQSLLDALRARFGDALITHIYASTELGVGFSVRDGREGFPTDYLDRGAGDVRLKIAQGRLWLRPPGDCPDYVGAHHITRDQEGFADTQDQVEQRGDRILFLGRNTGVVNVGGAKVNPETVERTIHMMPEVALVRVSSRRNPLSGAVLVAQIVPVTLPQDIATLKRRVVQHCRRHLPPEAVPALVQISETLMVNAAGKLVRN